MKMNYIIKTEHTTYKANTKPDMIREIGCTKIEFEEILAGEKKGYNVVTKPTKQRGLLKLKHKHTGEVLINTRTYLKHKCNLNNNILSNLYKGFTKTTYNGWQLFDTIESEGRKYNKKIWFGKYKGRYIDTIPTQYLQWLKTTDFFNDIYPETKNIINNLLNKYENENN